MKHELIQRKYTRYIICCFVLLVESSLHLLCHPSKPSMHLKNHSAVDRSNIEWLILVIGRDHINKQPLHLQLHFVQLCHLPVILSNHRESLLVCMHHDSVSSSIVKAADLHEAPSYKLSLVHRIVVKSDEPTRIFGALAICISFIVCVNVGFLNGCRGNGSHVKICFRESSRSESERCFAMMHKGSCPEGNNESNDKLQGRKHEETVQQLRLKRMDAVLLVLLWWRDQRGAVGG
mmetsp:Transcript_13865/g.29898  ORF Transcript_13865/g.29898 Transcript_13865/m.29898 type:complete len:234 (+) Transcript_13865:151-852(+)